MYDRAAAFALWLSVSCAIFGQDASLIKLQREAARLRSLPSDKANEPATLTRGLHLMLRDWVESQLPDRAGGSLGNLQTLEATLRSKLTAAGLTAPEVADPEPEGPGLGYVAIQFEQIPELPDALVVVAGTSVECGQDQAVYMYRFDPNGRVPVFLDHPESKWGYMFANFEHSDPDSRGRLLLLIHYMSTQCASTWMGMAYSVYRLSSRGSVDESLLSNKHGVYVGNDGPEFVLKPEELIVEFLDSSVDSAIHNRTEIHHYTFGAGVGRADPVAFQPQDFAEEWLTRPWSEMESRSAEQTKEWHDRLHGDYVSADYVGVVPCARERDQWMISLDVGRIDAKELPEPVRTYFLVRDLGSYRYRMESVGRSRPPGCPTFTGDAGHASEKHPWLSAAELRSLQ
jgi:hypothetical protein